MSTPAIRRPYVLTLLVVAVIATVPLAYTAGMAVLRGIPPVRIELIAELVAAFLVAGLVTAVHGWRMVGFRALRSPKDWRLYWVPALPLFPVIGAAVAGISRIPARDVGVFLALACLIGFVEEVAFRGLILRAFATRGIWQATIFSSVLFGLMHLLNLLSGADLVATLLQVGYAMAMGFGFAAVTLRTGAVWPLVGVHALIDFAGFTSAGATVGGAVTATDAAVYALYIVAFTGYGLLVMRAVRRSAVLDRARAVPVGS